MSKAVLSVVIVLISALAFGQDEFDDLFSDGLIIVEDEESSENQSDIHTEQESDHTPKIKTAVNLKLGGMVGYLDWADFAVPERTSFGALASSTGSLEIDYRSAGILRYYSKISTELDVQKVDYVDIEIDELFVDYILLDNYQFRIGQFSQTWGKGRIFSNPGNFVADMNKGFGIKCTLPLLGNSFTAVTYSDEVLINRAGPEKLGYGYNYDFYVGDIVIGSSAMFRAGQPLNIGLSMQMSINSFDIAFENIANMYYDEKIILHKVDYLYVVSTFYQNDDVTLVIESEGKLDFLAKDYQVSGGFGLTLNKIRLFKMKPGLRVLHNFGDNSGQVVLGMKGLIFNKLSMELAIPMVYGSDNSYYMKNNEDPDNRVVGLVILFSIEESFS